MSKTTGWIIGIVVVIVLAVGGFAVLHKSSTKTNSSTTTANTSTNTSSSSQATKNASINPQAVVQTKTASSVGSYLADASGNALYTYNGDTTGVSNCNSGCTSAWPPYTPGPTTGLQANVTVITRSDGSKQYAYKGMPLYTFTSDSNGQVTGNGVANFSVAKP